MKAKDAVRVSTLRLLVSAFRNKEIEKKKALGEAEVLEVVQAEAKRRRESIDEFRKANRTDLAAREEAELQILKAYLPPALSPEELKALVQSAIASIDAHGAQDMGRVMSAVMPQIRGRADGREAQQLVKELLS
jgi:uncharacterized protein YqeY